MKEGRHDLIPSQGQQVKERSKKPRLLMIWKNASLVIVLLHLAVLLGHGAAHSHLGIGTRPWQTVFIAMVIFIGPVLALPLIWTRWRNAGTWLLGLTMAGALVFGLYYHFMASGPDNVSTLNNAGWGGAFRTSAVLLAAIEAVGVAGCVWVLLGRRKPFERE